MNGNASECFQVRVDYDALIEEMLDSYGFASPELNGKNFISERNGVRDVEVILMRSPQIARSEDALRKFGKRAARPAELREVLPLAARRPDILSGRRRIVVLDVWRDTLHIDHVPVFGSEPVSGSERVRRYVRLSTFGNIWDENCLFACVPKNSE